MEPVKGKKISLRWSPGTVVPLITFLFCGIFSYLQSRKYSDGIFGRWADVSSLWSDASLTSCLTVSAAASYMVQLYCRRDGIFIAIPARRSPVVGLMKLNRWIPVSGAVGTVVGALPLLMFVSATATGEHFEVRNLVYFCAVLVLAYAVGVVAGVVVRSVLAVPLAFAMVVMWFQLPNVIGDRSFAVIPLRPVGQEPGQIQGTWVTFFGTTMLLVSACTLLMLGHAILRRPRTVGTVALSSSAVFGAGLISALLPLAGPPPLWDLVDDPERRCASGDLVSVCVNTAHLGDLAPTVEEVSPVIERLSYDLDTAPVLIDTTLLHHPHELSEEVIVYAPNAAGTGGSSSLVAERLSGSTACLAAGASDSRWAASSVFFEWLNSGTVRTEVDMTIEELQLFMQENKDRIAHCSVDVSEVASQ